MRSQRATFFYGYQKTSSREEAWSMTLGKDSECGNNSWTNHGWQANQTNWLISKYIHWERQLWKYKMWKRGNLEEARIVVLWGCANVASVLHYCFWTSIFLFGSVFQENALAFASKLTTCSKVLLINITCKLFLLSYFHIYRYSQQWATNYTDYPAFFCIRPLQPQTLSSLFFYKDAPRLRWPCLTITPQFLRPSFSK